jgi:hypothetical protein
MNHKQCGIVLESGRVLTVVFHVRLGRLPACYRFSSAMNSFEATFIASSERARN